jgi:hypothetical protein
MNWFSLFVTPFATARDWVDYFTLTISFCLLMVGFFGVRYARKTLRIIERQTKASENASTAARDTAESSLKTAESFVHAERPWILVKTVSGPKNGWYEPKDAFYTPGATIEFAVYGNTPAKMTDARVYLVNVPAKIGVEPVEPAFPEIPEYPKRPWNNEIPQNGRMLPPNDKFYASFILDPPVSREDEWNQLWEWKRCICLYGFVSYGDTFGNNHETRFCYVYEVSRGGVIQDTAGNILNPSRFRIGGPEAYNRNT